MAIRKEHYDFDPEKFEDEFLVIMARKGSIQGRQGLMLRYYEHVKRKIKMLARQKKLPASEIPDAQEEGVLWLEEAIERYDVNPHARTRPFGSSLDWLLEKRLSDYVRGYRRREKHFNRWPEGEPGLESATAQRAGQKVATISRRKTELDPAREADDHEFRGRLNGFLAELDENFRHLWECMQRGRKLAWVCTDLGISVSTAKRWKKGYWLM
jgi:RNA polymerase sigma factor (sigma-70 family)